jgi:hypothetical protein
LIPVGVSPRDFYYSNQWQVIQESSVNTAGSSEGTAIRADHYVWGIAYVNELVLRDAYDGLSLTGSGLDQRLYAFQDANYNVTALVGPVSGSWTISSFYMSCLPTKIAEPAGVGSAIERFLYAMVR